MGMDTKFDTHDFRDNCNYPWPLSSGRILKYPRESTAGTKLYVNYWHVPLMPVLCVARISVWGGAQMPHRSRRRGGVVWGRCPLPRNFFLNFYIKVVSCRAFWVAIIYRLAACFTGIGITCGIEIYWRLFQQFGNYNYSFRKICAQ